MTKLIELTCEGDPKAVYLQQLGVNGRPARYQVDTYQQVRERVSFVNEANLGGTAGCSVLSLIWDRAVFLCSKRREHDGYFAETMATVQKQLMTKNKKRKHN